MRFRTHFAFGIFLYFVLDYISYLPNKILSFVLIVFFSILPDIDLHTSVIGRRVRPISNLLEFFFQHRGFFHSIWMVIILYLVLKPFNLGLTVFGYLGHLGLDVITKKGLHILWPFIKLKGNLLTGRLFDFVAFMLLSMVDMVLIVGIFL